MTASISELAAYAGALFLLFMTPGPVWAAIVARAISGGFQAALPLALGVVVGDVLWPFLAILGVSWIVNEVAWLLTVFRLGAAALFFWMGYGLIRHADKIIGSDNRLTRPGFWAGFSAGLAAILGNPKAIIFYMFILPAFFDLTQITKGDITAIVMLSFAVPLIGNLGLALFLDRVRNLLRSPQALRRLNQISGGLLIAVGLVIPFT
ncbi:MAG: LysE family translocator [Mangrovicoccus sp.]